MNEVVLNKKVYSNEFRLKVAKEAVGTSTAAAARKFKVNASTVANWRGILLSKGEGGFVGSGYWGKHKEGGYKGTEVDQALRAATQGFILRVVEDALEELPGFIVRQVEERTTKLRQELEEERTKRKKAEMDLRSLRYRVQGLAKAA